MNPQHGQTFMEPPVHANVAHAVYYFKKSRTNFCERELFFSSFAYLFKVELALNIDFVQALQLNEQ